MKLFACGRCGSRLYFENVVCNGCGAALGFDPQRLDLLALEPADGPPAADGILRWRAVGPAPGQRDADPPAEAEATLRLCANGREHAVCNWLLPDDSPHALCLACRLNHTIPDLGVPGHLGLWQTLETEKRRLVYALLRLGLPVVPHSEDAAGLAFDFLAETGQGLPEREPVLTGHRDGLITINIAEADPAERERMRTRVAEPYRTLLGHFRHESAHYYWDRLVRDDPARLDAFRAQMGDERQDYAQALDRHYREGPPADWGERFVSAYASSHPWEDWAETWAHALLIIDTLETAAQYGLQSSEASPATPFDAYVAPDFAPLAARWLPLSLALNSLNRSMGHAHAYPFVLTPMVIAKLGFVHGVMRQAVAAVEPAGDPAKEPVAKAPTGAAVEAPLPAAPGGSGR